mgnify:FL=1
MAERRALWLAHNDLRPVRPMVLCYPEGAWTELLPDSALQCRDALARRWERGLRHTIYWWQHIRDDNVVEPFFDVPWEISIGDYGVKIPYAHGDQRGSYVWDPPLKDLPADLDRLHFRPLAVDRERTQRNLALANEIFGDLLPARIRGKYWWTAGLTWEAVKLVGLEQLMLLMYDQPETVHRLMAFLRDETLHFIQWFERQELLSPGNGNSYTGSGGVGYTGQLPGNDGPEFRPAKLGDLWGFAESQETVGISPAMFAEFVLPYQLPILEKFGLNCYGCCEQLHTRIDRVLAVPRLRRVSVSPWADQRVMAEHMDKSIIFSRKPNPTIICMDFDEQRIRHDLRQTLEHAQGRPLEIIMKDTHTVQNEPWRIERWVRLAMDEVARSTGGGAIDDWSRQTPCPAASPTTA